MALELYKPDEATRWRGGLAVVTAALLLYGVISLYDWMGFGFWQRDLVAGRLGDEFPISPRVLLCAALTVAIAFGLYVILNNQRVVEFLIATDVEMQKVSWPTKSEVIASSIVVIITVAILAVYLGAVDYGLVTFKNAIPWDGIWDRLFGAGG